VNRTQTTPLTPAQKPKLLFEPESIQNLYLSLAYRRNANLMPGRLRNISIHRPML
jgi:hypothetical protein